MLNLQRIFGTNLTQSRISQIEFFPGDVAVWPRYFFQKPFPNNALKISVLKKAEIWTWDYIREK